MRKAFRDVLVACAGAVLAAAVFYAGPPAAGQAPLPRILRTADGKPNLNGLWQALNTANYDLEAHVDRLALGLGGGVRRLLGCAALLLASHGAAAQDVTPQRIALACATAPVRSEALSPGERRQLETLAGTRRAAAWCCGRAALKRLLLRLGPDATVVAAPEPLVGCGAAAAARVLARYEAGS